MAESGFPGFEATTWYGLAGPAKMNPGVVKRMNEDFNEVLAMPDVLEKFAQYGAEDGGGSSQKFAALIRSESVKWAKVIKDANVKMDA
jgi:tripartite-type tricarboxylate transporter receptor subunit TctC